MSKEENETAKRRKETIERASLVGIVGNALLSAAKIVGGLLGQSLALMADGIDSFTDVVTSTVTYYTARIVDKPPDKMHPYGHGRAETIATKALSFVIFFAGVQLLISSLRHLFGDVERQLPETYALIIAGVSVLGKMGLALVKYRAGKKANSSMLIADAKNMSMDVAISLSVLLGLFVTIQYDLVIVDSLVAFAVSVWIMRIGFGIFMDTSVELMDGLQDRSIYNSVADAALTISGIHNPHKMRIRKSNTRYIVDLDVEVDGGLSVEEGHRKAMEVEHKIHEKVPDVYDVHVHVEPRGAGEHHERYGIAYRDLDE